jgi:predicted nucleic acid-binding protein
MGHYYFDSSALVKRYVNEAGTAWMNDLCAVAAGHTLYTVRISGAEIAAAFFLRARTGTLVIADAQAALRQFKAAFHSRYQVVEVTKAVVNKAMMLVEVHDLRGYDAVQLAAALELQAARHALSLSEITFVCADDKLNSAAGSEGLSVENPNDH